MKMRSKVIIAVSFLISVLLVFEPGPRMSKYINDGDWTYYINGLYKNGVYKYNTVTKEDIQLAEIRASTIYPSTDWIYFKKVHTSTIYRVAKEGFGAEWVMEDCSSLVVHKDKIYYFNFENPFLHVSDLDGTNSIQLTDFRTRYLRAKEDYLHIKRYNSEEEYRIDYETNEMELIENSDE